MIISPPYTDIYNLVTIPPDFSILDHLGGFDANLTNPMLDHLSKISQQNTVTSTYIFDEQVKKYYSNINFKVSQTQLNLFQKLSNYNIHPELDYKNFICSFNGSGHVSRKLLVSILEKFKYYNPEYCSKNFSYSADILDGHINDYVPDQINLYRKFFISADSEDFFQTVNSFGHVRFEHNKNIYNLENKLTESFLHIVSESLATTYYPFLSEKPFYSIVTRGLFLTYAQPGWHAHIEKYLGFKLYTNLFDYKFDLIQNPVERLVELMTMVGKFSKLTPLEWHDLYLLEQDNIEFNYDHYFSRNYLKVLKEFDE
jgi:hypothetical protein|tara:strand:- start:643 stop:1581 length:939 start_codon:yes stop_codon:yes gene_type:complete